MKLNLCSYPNFTLFSGNVGTAGTAQQNRGSQRSRIKHKSGNKGTQLRLIKSHTTLLVPAKKTQGTCSRCETPDLEPSHPRSRVPTDFEFSRVNKGGVCAVFVDRMKTIRSARLITTHINRPISYH